jgi:hypothetical protein
MRIGIIDSAGTNPYPYRHDGPSSAGALYPLDALPGSLEERAAEAAHPLREPAS